ncbi:hypothetical protein CEXT_478631 [Caerostris extrusa]|uniref:Uncharacterized protein n=1 Tax=Caerostris extrusa TaxID=172846 RepID=A0AAV4XXT8_CAEEX|nr:hypothetical protein CEXT_478631 [Caerostris extrusa]
MIPLKGNKIRDSFVDLSHDPTGEKSFGKGVGEHREGQGLHNDLACSAVRKIRPEVSFKKRKNFERYVNIL